MDTGITQQDEERYMAIMAGFDAAMADLEKSMPVPMCHFTPMTLHLDDTEPGNDDHWYECEHCGHTEDITDAWAKAKAHEAAQVLPSTNDDPF